MRLYLYILAGLVSSLIGWNIAQILLADLRLADWVLFNQVRELVIFPCVASVLAAGMVANEMFLSNPTRPRLNLRILWMPTLIAAGLGFVAGLLAGGLYWLVFTHISLGPRLLRILAWLLIGIGIGLSEGYTWRWRSMEAGDKRRFQQRLIVSSLSAVGAAFMAALLFEVLRRPVKNSAWFQTFEDPLGLALLSAMLGIVLSMATSPSHMVALRAGTGFEFTYEDENPPPHKIYPSIQLLGGDDQPLLKFVSDPDNKRIEEGVSIQLPRRGKVRIGGDVDMSDIFLPGLPKVIASLEIHPRETILIPNNQHLKDIEFNGKPLYKRRIRLRHNNILSFYSDMGGSNGKKRFRFVYYNRFLDPLA